MAEDMKQQITETFPPLMASLERGIPGLETLREDLERIVVACNRVLQILKDRPDTREHDLKKPLTIVSREIERTLAVLNHQKQITGDRLRSRGNRKKLEKAYQSKVCR